MLIGNSFPVLVCRFKDLRPENLSSSDGPKCLQPKKTYGDGNCLYRATSRTIRGNEDRHVKLGMRTCIELCMTKDKHLNDCYLKELT